MISTTSHEVQSLPQIFKGRPKRTRHHEIRSAFSVDTPSRQSICFQGLSQCCQNEKTSHPGVWVNVSEFVCVTAFANHSLARTESKPVIGDGILTIFPFRPRWHYALASAPHFNPLAVCFRIDSPMSNCCSHGTFLHFSLQSSHLNICYYHQDLHRRPLRPGSRPGFCGDRRALLLIGAWPLPRRPGIGRALKRHPFSGLVDSAGELLHTP